MVVGAIPAVWPGGPQAQVLSLSICLQITDFYILNVSFPGPCAFGYFEACYMPSFYATFFFFNRKDESLRYFKEEDSLVGIVSNSFLWGRTAVEAE